MATVVRIDLAPRFAHAGAQLLERFSESGFQVRIQLKQGSLPHPQDLGQERARAVRLEEFSPDSRNVRGIPYVIRRQQVELVVLPGARAGDAFQAGKGGFQLGLLTYALQHEYVVGKLWATFEPAIKKHLLWQCILPHCKCDILPTQWRCSSRALRHGCGVSASAL